MVENTGNRGFLSDEVNDDGLYPIYGLALGDNDITVGQKSGEPKLWRPDVLEEAAETLTGKDIVVNHENQDAYMKIGEVEEAKYEEGRGVLYRGAIDDDELAGKIARDWLEVSPRIKHTKEHEEIQGVKVPEAIRDFDNLSIVRRGAAGSNELILGETEELSVEELQDSFETDTETEVSEYQSIADEDLLEELGEDIDYSRWMYDDREGAEGAAVRFGCEGTHTHEVDGETWYMPCETHDKFLKGLRETDSEDMEENDETLDEVDEADEMVEDEFSESEKDEYSREEKQMASQMASYSELTKSECLSIVDVFNPSRNTNHSTLAQLIYKVVGDDGMDKLYSELDKEYKEKEYAATAEQDSPLNSIFG